MQGADEFCKVFKKREQFGRLSVVPGNHARGDTFEIYVLDSDAPHSAGEGVLVYGMTGGQSGWTETYGWIHKGRWVDDFNQVYEKRKAEMEKSRGELKRLADSDAKAKKTATMALLADY